jgi:hypothetical protein
VSENFIYTLSKLIKLFNHSVNTLIPDHFTEGRKWIYLNKIYRVSIMSFPDYKHLLQENYVKYKHIFLPLRGKCSNKMVHLHTGIHMFVGFWMQHFQIGGLGEMLRHPGHHDRLISPPSLLLWGYIKDKVFSTPVSDITNFKSSITDAFATCWRTRREKLIID